MGIVKISDSLHNEIRKASTIWTRSINAQAEYWIKIGLLAELNPELNYNQLCKKLLRTQPFTLEALAHE
ncbi:ParD-like family protein [Microbulbifer sp. 2304DJ12-6]|uniref:ParD-like family protein n=1 Tax=Microbulbifer sp. 2304DJ12-6 TaxID=3233340 RepID=UPI002605355E|nr:ParD-like family protein [uncultured Microbulbifer sp.]